MEKKCSCCNKLVTPKDLIYLGYQEGPRFDLLLFNCDCGSTLGFKVQQLKGENNENVCGQSVERRKLETIRSRSGWNVDSRLSTNLRGVK